MILSICLTQTSDIQLSSFILFISNDRSEYKIIYHFFELHLIRSIIIMGTIISIIIMIVVMSTFGSTYNHSSLINPMVLQNNIANNTNILLSGVNDKNYYVNLESTTSIFTPTSLPLIETMTTTLPLLETTLFFGNTTAASITSSEIHCPTNFEDFVLPETELFCNWTWDTYLCWPPTAAGSVARQKCPPHIGLDVTQFAERKCDLNGRWLGYPENNSHYNPVGWTNFTNCWKPDIAKLINKCNKGGNCTEKFSISERTRILEIVGLTLSLCTLVISLIIFFNFRSLRNARTKIHKNLFVAMVIQVVIRLILYFDQAIIRPISKQLAVHSSSTLYGIENTPYICEGSYVLLEYARTAMFMWMFIEGLYLHSGVTWMTGARRFPYIAYAILGWGAPLIMTAIWAYFTGKYNGDEKCWFNYNLTPYYWILEGPRLAVVLLNLFFLLNIIRVLVVKLRESHSSDLEQLRKAVRAAIVLLPLLGITNLLYLTDPPLDKSVLEFALWSYVTYFFSSFQGLFIAVIYCFLNGEVRTALKKSLSVYMSLRGNSNWAPRQASIFSGAYNTAPDTEGQLNDSVNRNESNSPPTRNRNNSNRLNNRRHTSWMMSLCFRGQKVLREPPASTAPESVVFELSEH